MNEDKFIFILSGSENALHQVQDQWTGLWKWFYQAVKENTSKI